MIKLIEPTLLLDRAKCLKNINDIVEKAKANNVFLRPHFKTHQSQEIGRWFKNLGVEKITASSLKMAEYFAADGWQDISVAFPINVHEIDRINSLAEKITLNLLVVAPETIERLSKDLKFPVNVFIEVDSGDHRTGVNPVDFATIDQILSEINRFEHTTFKGFLTHAGHSYGVRRDNEEIAKIYRESTSVVSSLKAKYFSQYPDLIISYGDTPTCSIMDNFEGVDELRPGNLVFYDVVQSEIGACQLDQIAVAMACPVVAKNPDRNEIVIYGGAVHFSKDSIFLHDGTKSFGKVVNLTENGWETSETGAYIKSLSQEHGVISAPDDYFEKIKLGDFIGVLPIHSCLTVDLNSAYLTLESEKIEKFRFYD
ncbi:MAG TPA: alanine racemase [Pyrinomonadaceae bacterium]|nr:alanine racemase [Pyrinomonadaceae bacterium]